MKNSVVVVTKDCGILLSTTAEIYRQSLENLLTIIGDFHFLLDIERSAFLRFPFPSTSLIISKERRKKTGTLPEPFF